MTGQPKLLNSPKHAPGSLSRILAIIGFIILLIIVIWGLAHMAVLSSPCFSSLFRQASPVTPPTTIVIQEPAKVAPSQKPQTKVTYSGPADLRVQIIFATVDSYGNGIVQFDIANIGSSPSGTYYFEAHLPTSLEYLYTSPAQASLNPGDHIQSTLNFTEAFQGRIVAITVDPANLVRESNETNNYASQTLRRQYQYGY